MVFEQTKRIVNRKLRKIGIKVHYRLWKEKYEESWVYEHGHVVHLNPDDRRSSTLAIESMEHLLLHEIAHIVVNDYLLKKIKGSEEAQKLFGDLTRRYRRDLKRKYKNKDFISTYAQVHPEDNFAEVFAVFANLEGDFKKIRKFLRKSRKSNLVLKQMFWMRDFLESIKEKQRKGKRHYHKVISKRRFNVKP